MYHRDSKQRKRGRRERRRSKKESKEEKRRVNEEDTRVLMEVDFDHQLIPNVHTSTSLDQVGLPYWLCLKRSN